MAVSTTHVAWCSHAEEIWVVSVADGAETTLQKSAPELTDQMWLTETGHLFIVGPYSTVARYDLASGRRDWTVTSQGGAGPDVPDIASVSMNRARTGLAVLMRGGTELRVIDAQSTVTRDRLMPENAVRSSGTAFTAAALAQLTDHGCLARYRLHAR